MRETLTPAQAEDVRRQIAWDREDGRLDRADRWASRLSDAEAQCSVCDAPRLPAVRWCAEHAPQLIVPFERRGPGERARAVVLQHPGATMDAQAEMAGCSVGTIQRARRSVW